VAAPNAEALRDLIRWRPPHGVLSVYVDLEPGDRGEAWRIELRNGLREVVERATREADRETRIALERTAKRVERLADEPGRPNGRARVGFIEVGGAERERTYSLAVSTGPTTVDFAPRPVLHGLLAALDDAAPRGVVAASWERVRLLDWRVGELEPIDDWGLEIFSLDWRERKSRSSSDLARAQMTTSSGRDQFEQRLDHNRERFLHETGRLAAERAKGRDWRQLLVFAEDEAFRLFAEGYGGAAPVRHAEHRNLIAQPDHAIAERVEAMLDDLTRERERALLERVTDEAHGGTRGAVGVEETVQALIEGRVEHLLLDPTRGYELPDDSPLADGNEAGLTLAERMVELALATGAAVTPLEGDAAERLGEAGGVAALLRY
jgi:hypothetical protein